MLTSYFLYVKKVVFSIKYVALYRILCLQYPPDIVNIQSERKAPILMSLDKFLNMKPKQLNERMDIQNPEKVASLPWVQKYRPNKLDEITYQQQVTNTLRNVLKTGNLPHLLFYGPAGTGKTSAIIALSKQLFGPKFYKERVLQLNASDQRGIGVIREKVKKFAQSMCIKNIDKTYLCPNFKVIVLDEADLMTTDAQSALRRIIQDNSSTTRFCIICNYITKIIEPLSSRCVKFRFKPIPLTVQMQKLKSICISEDVRLQEKQLINLLQKGDLRQSINSLQSLHRLKNIPSELLPIGQQYGVTLLQKIKAATHIRQAYNIGQNIAFEGYAYDEVLNSLSKAILKSKISERKKAMMLENLSKCEQNLLLGATQLPILEIITTIFYIFNLHL